MNLIIDGGNTFIKAYLFRQNGELKKNIRCAPEEMPALLTAFTQDENISAGIYSNVGSDQNEIYSELKKDFPFLVQLTRQTKLPFQLNYDTPETLGLDRLALAAGLQKHASTAMAVDCGSCITYEVLVNDVYQGGAISPGLQMRLKSMHTFTAGLPHVEDLNMQSFPAKSTRKCMITGTINAVLHEINGFIDTFKAHHQSAEVILTGGDVKYLADALKKRTFANPFLTAEGLNKILNDQI